MKKMMIALLLVSICGFLFAQDTVFSIYNGEKEPVSVMFPRGIYNPRATMEQNVQAWYYKKVVPFSAESNSKYIGIFHRVEIYTQTNLVFDGNKNVFIKDSPAINDLPLNFAWEIIPIFPLSLFIMAFYQKTVVKKSISNAKTAFMIVIMIGFVSMVLCANSFFAPIAMVTISLSVGFVVPLIFERWEYKLSLQRNIFMISSLCTMTLFYLLSKSPVLIFGAFGLFLGLPTIYFWRNRDRKRMKLYTKVHYSVI
jgi:hypothetical protein